jgi:hypothetical protein
MVNSNPQIASLALPQPGIALALGYGGKGILTLLI